MNSNRSQYSSAPTYGLQKKGLAKKLGFRTEKENLVPDFEAYPAQTMQVSQAVETTQAPSAPSTPAAAPGYAAPQPMQLQFNAAVEDPYVPYASVPQPAMPQNTRTSAAYGGRNPAGQGNGLGYGYYAADPYVPYANGSWQAPTQSAYKVGSYPSSNAAPAPGQASSPNMYQGGYYQQNPFYPSGANPFVPQKGAASGAGASAPMGMNPPEQPENPYYGANPFAPSSDNTPPPAQAGSAQPKPEPAAPAAPVQPEASQVPYRKVSVNQLIALYLYGILPIVFIIAFFQTPIFYAFIALALMGIGVLWYRGMYAKPVRWIVTGLVALMCIIGVISILRSPQGTAALQPSGQTGSAQYTPTATPSPEEGYSGDPLATETPSPTPAPTSEPSNAEKRLCSFMDLWAVNNAESMVGLVQPSWVSKQSDPAQALFVLLANRTVQEYTIESISGTESESSRAVTLTAKIDKHTGKDPSLYRFTIMMVKEGDEWYVNPNSIATNDAVTTTEDDVVVNDSNSKGLATEPPRQTVTPIPAGSTKLYYNVNGGSYYHTDPYCSAVNSAYTPLTGTFSYSELGNYNSNLSPCTKCKAPVYTLPPE